MGNFQRLIWMAEFCHVRFSPLLQPLLGNRHPGVLGNAVQREERSLAAHESETSGFGKH